MGSRRPTSPAPVGVPRPRLGRRGGALLTVLVVTAACGAGQRNSAASTTTSTTALSTTASSTTTPGLSQWTTYGGGFGRTSLDGTTHVPATSLTSLWTSPSLDGAVYGEPLIFDGQVLVASANNTVYALSATTGKILWSDHLATPAPAGALPCGDISPTVGITSTMVIDPAAGMIYASAETSTNGAVGHAVYGIDLATHKVAWSRDVDQPGWAAAAQLQRIGLGLSAGHVLVGFGGNYGDCGRYNGWLVGVPETGRGPLLAYKVPTAREGAIWAPAGVTVNAAGDVFVATGNGSATAGQPFDHGDAVIELSPALHEIGYFAPTNWAQDNAEDGDLGSTSPVLLDGGQIFEVGKQTTAYLLDSAALGGIGGQVASLDVCGSLGGNAYQSPDVYVVCPGSGEIAQVRVGPGNTMARGWTWRSPTGGASSPTIAGGVVFSIDLRAEKLYAIDPSTGATSFSVALSVGTPEHFAAPSSAGGMIVVAGSSAVEAFVTPSAGH
jgi:outer membrane protein assembly factor BamB